MLRVGLIGCGGIGAVHMECWRAMPDKVQLVAIADTDIAKIEKYGSMGISVYQDGFRLLEEEKLDVVDICVPTFLHAAYLKKAMLRVKNVIVEKPLCLTEEEVQDILHMQEETGALVQVAHVVRFTDAYRYLKELVDSGIYGKVIAGNFWRISPRPLWMKGHDDRNRTGTMTLDLHIHDVDYIRYLMGGDPDELQTRSVKDENGVVQHIWSAYRYGTAMLSAEGSWDYPKNLPFSQTFRVKLEKAAVIFDEKGTLTVYPAEGEAIVPQLRAKCEMDMNINVSDMGPYLNELHYFVQMILQNNKDGIACLSEAAASFRLAKKELDLAQMLG